MKTNYQKNKYRGNNNYSNNNREGGSNNNYNNYPTNKPSSKIKCFNCREMGHMSKQCPQKKSSLKNLEESTSTSNSIELTRISESEGNQERLLRFNGSVNGRKA